MLSMPLSTGERQRLPSVITDAIYVYEVPTYFARTKLTAMLVQSGYMPLTQHHTLSRLRELLPQIVGDAERERAHDLLDCTEADRELSEEDRLFVSILEQAAVAHDPIYAGMVSRATEWIAQHEYLALKMFLRDIEQSDIVMAYDAQQHVADQVLMAIPQADLAELSAQITGLLSLTAEDKKNSGSQLASALSPENSEVVSLPSMDQDGK